MGVSSSPQAEERARAAEQLVGEVAHELSRPLAAVLNYTELALQDEALAPATRARLEVVLREAERCRELVHRFLELVRPAQPYTEEVEVAATVQEAAETVAERARKAGARVVLEAEEGLPRVRGEARQLEAAVRNLLENAIDAVEGQEGAAVRATVRAAPGGVRLTVEDNGPGVPEELRERLLEPFFTTKEGGKGTGLGLPITQRIVEEHGGRLSVREALGGGTAVVVELPGTVDGKEGVRRTATAETASGQERTALVIDDDVSMRKLLSAYLAQLGFTAEEAADGAQALQASRARAHDIIICDVKMPGMGGVEYYQALREEAPGQEQRVIFATGVLPTDDEDRALRALPNARLRKPFHLPSLKVAVEETLGAGGALRANGIDDGEQEEQDGAGQPARMGGVMAMIVALDIDDTLAPMNEPAERHVIERLRRMQEQGVRIALASGKPCAYLAGFARAYLHARETILIGENGSDVWLTGIMPAEVLALPVSEAAVGGLEAVREALEREFGRQVFFQPNRVTVTAFPPLDSEVTPAVLGEFVGAMRPEGVTIYQHRDSTDCAPTGVDKGTALEAVLKRLGMEAREAVAVGDSDNDIPMFRVAGFSVCVGGHPRASKAATVVVGTIEEALEVVEGR